ncbi:6318_t:CDS:1 [Acaulospora colombiana]|uniref:6318_t:CDS:1 n=1 Tax=Acaulospora colombiana TaxID=27376 RepID=A0ACA9PLB0_9GLOM|nr:6318_t:CDS:1 [Acaulospora colombiana]
MSLSRALYNEFQPYFRLFEDPFVYQPSSRRSVGDPTGWHRSSPALNLQEEEDGSYVIEAEVPGVRKENLDVRVGDGGRSLTIEGRVVRRSQQQQQDTPQQQEATTATPADTSNNAYQKSSSTAVVPSSNGKQPSLCSDDRADTNTLIADTEKQVSTNTSWAGSRTFSRTVWLPHAINREGITARLEDGILTIRAPRASQEAFSVRVD